MGCPQGGWSPGGVNLPQVSTYGAISLGQRWCRKSLSCFSIARHGGVSRLEWLLTGRPCRQWGIAPLCRHLCTEY
ncbi:hypothetical protein UCMB321_0489 [Pseudomonas batumici]|uniref:Uncharacterized protein n=1 Tax=Pseudomonas batumici TaxID=226910 RepID=A0A0C2IMA5_9PSED|nr:hypothetical protein UCMB321_0489 [Pseudomonas batumici]